MIACVRFNGRIEDTTLKIDEASELVAMVPDLHLFLRHEFSCYEECSLMECLGPLCPNEEEIPSAVSVLRKGV
jgi:hypothetical protein